MSFFFRRALLVEQMARAILSNDTRSAVSSGLFLASPPGTGKSTFLREDLRPYLQKAGAVVMYIDLSAKAKADLGAVLVSAGQAHLAKRDGASSVGYALGKDVDLSGALAALSDETKKPIVLLIDEAQHAITTEAGYDALFALKAARDELNSSAHHGLRIVATGSNRDKLAMLCNSKDQAFFGAPLVSFPPLGMDYIEWFCKGVGLAGPLEPAEVMRLFERASFRPEIIGAAADALRFDFGLDTSNIAAAFATAVDSQIGEADAQTLRVIHALTPLQSAVLRVLAFEGDKYAPFESGTMRRYGAVLRTIAPEVALTPEVSNVQQALAALQDKSLVWREKRGVYSLEESTTAELLRREGLLDACVVPAS